ARAARGTRNSVAFSGANHAGRRRVIMNEPTRTPDDTAGTSRNRLHPLSAAEFLRLELPPRRLIIDPWLPEKGLAMIYAPRGVGKTLFALSLSYAIAAGAPLLGFAAPEPRRVLYLDGEMPASTMQARLAAIVHGAPVPPPNDTYFRMLSGDLTA